MKEEYQIAQRANVSSEEEDQGVVKLWWVKGHTQS
jgi:hypothetical protein